MEVYLGNQECNLGKVLSSILNGFVSNTTFFSSGVFCFLGFGIFLVVLCFGLVVWGGSLFVFIFFLRSWVDKERERIRKDLV